jgi:hypothetical protein
VVQASCLHDRAWRWIGEEAGWKPAPQRHDFTSDPANPMTPPEARNARKDGRTPHPTRGTRGAPGALRRRGHAGFHGQRPHSRSFSSTTLQTIAIRRYNAGPHMGLTDFD